MFIHPLLDCVHRLPCCIPYWLKCCRKRGNHGGTRVKIRRRCLPVVWALVFYKLHRAQRPLPVYLILFDPRYSCQISIVPVPDWTPMTGSTVCPRLCVCSGGVNLSNIRPLEYTWSSRSSVCSVMKATLVHYNRICYHSFDICAGLQTA